MDSKRKPGHHDPGVELGDPAHAPIGCVTGSRSLLHQTNLAVIATPGRALPDQGVLAKYVLHGHVYDMDLPLVAEDAWELFDARPSDKELFSVSHPLQAKQVTPGRGLALASTRLSRPATAASTNQLCMCFTTATLMSAHFGDSA